MSKSELLADLQWLLAEGRKISKSEAPELGQHFDTGLKPSVESPAAKLLPCRCGTWRRLSRPSLTKQMRSEQCLT